MALPATDCGRIVSEACMADSSAYNSSSNSCARSCRSAWRSASDKLCSRASRSMANKLSMSATARSNFASVAWDFVCTLMTSMNPRRECAKQKAWIRYGFVGHGIWDAGNMELVKGRALVLGSETTTMRAGDHLGFGNQWPVGRRRCARCVCSFSVTLRSCKRSGTITCLAPAHQSEISFPALQ